MTETGPSLSADPVIGAVEVRTLRLPVREALATGRGQAIPGQVRELTVVGLLAADQPGLWGWGECAALAGSDYWFETASSSYEVLVAEANRLVGRTAQELSLISDLGAGPGRLPMATAAVEMAALNLALTADGQSLAGWIEARRTTSPAGATVGLGPVDETVEAVRQLHDQGYRRVKLKIEPGHDREPVAAVAEQVALVPATGRTDTTAGLELHVDANGSYRADDTGCGALVELATLGVAVIEQPFAIDDPAAAELVARLKKDGLPTLVMADESASSADDALNLLAGMSVAGVVVKPGRLGGIVQARLVIGHAAKLGRPVSIGGMLESGLGRHALSALAALDGVTIAGDVSPARRWLADDPWPDLEVVNNDNGLKIVTPTGPGVAPDPDRETLDRYTVARWASDPAAT